MEWNNPPYTITTDSAQLQLDVIYQFLTDSYWAKGIPKTTVQQSLEHSLNFGVFHETQQIGFARVISDYTTFAYLADVFVLESYRGKALSKWLMTCIMEHPSLQGLRRWLLATLDAHSLYEKYGFTPLAHPEKIMERHNPNIYQNKQ